MRYCSDKTLLQDMYIKLQRALKLNCGYFLQMQAFSPRGKRGTDKTPETKQTTDVENWWKLARLTRWLLKVLFTEPIAGGIRISGVMWDWPNIVKEKTVGVFTHAELILSLMHSCKLPFSVPSLSYLRKHNGTLNPTLGDLFLSVAADALSGIKRYGRISSEKNHTSTNQVGKQTGELLLPNPIKHA